ncbi:DUF411 domain-containing protein [Microbulbifer agarilyticus]|uniref:DUF411 domain-containing protein n=1 Tax=Microbulbifer agarilyticus TaxID=260552 RepID=UPI001C958251|nr:DUF411 domain-containing protein [Microbulbifer agarilyticus]MBY6210627.1 DUF411 domain-containing protein [Microbulbifer agarilyticus]MCA0891843.1 DUF411 domain-containing protein [Microbulbifer agarilyticus]
MPRLNKVIPLKLLPFALIALLLAGCSNTASTPEGQAPRDDANSITVYKSPFCLCCNDWITHLENNAFSVASENGLDTASVKRRWGVPATMQGCHTGVWNNQYVFEGHVPARLIRQFLANPPKGSIGLAVPGMPKGSPGMYRGKDFEPYVVYAILPNGEYRFYEKVTAPEAS